MKKRLIEGDREVKNSAPVVRCCGIAAVGGLVVVVERIKGEGEGETEAGGGGETGVFIASRAAAVRRGYYAQTPTLTPAAWPRFP